MWFPLYQPKRRAPHRDPPRTLRVLTARGERLGDAKLALASQLMRSALMLRINGEGMHDATRKGVLALVAGALSVPLAFFGLAISIKLGIRTPGVFVVGHLSPEDLHDSILGRLALQMGIDWLFWFALICTLYWLYGTLSRRGMVG
jgi:hypothetical protein